jgi:hypothetical protein
MEIKKKAESGEKISAEDARNIAIKLLNS